MTPSESTKEAAARLATETAQILEQVRAELAAVQQVSESIKTIESGSSEAHRLILAAQTEAQIKLAEITVNSTQAIAAGTQISDNQAVIAAKSAHIEDAQKHADDVRASLDEKLVEVTQQATEAEGLKARAQSAADKASTAHSEASAAKASAESDSQAATVAKKAAEEAAEISKALAEKAESIETRVADYEKRLAGFEEQCKEKLKQILDLLPGATTAGLAHSFDKRRKTFLWPQRVWQCIFIVALGAIISLAVTGLYQVYSKETAPTLEELARLWLARLPIAGALVWLAIHASREAALAKRLEEDYGYKAVVAASYLGFQKQMAEIAQAAAANTPSAQLCAVTLSTIAMPPGRIYDKHSLAASPTEELTRAAKAVTDAAAAKVKVGK